MIRWWVIACMVLCVVCVCADNDLVIPMPPIAAYQADGSLYIFWDNQAPVLVAEDVLPSIDTGPPVWSHTGAYLAYQADDKRVVVVQTDDLAVVTQVQTTFASRFTFRRDDGGLLYSTLGLWEPASNPQGFDTGTWQAAGLEVHQVALSDAVDTGLVQAGLPLIHEVDLMAYDSLGLMCPPSVLALLESRWTLTSPLLIADTPAGLVTFYNQSTEYTYQPELKIGESAILTPLFANAQMTHNGMQVIFAMAEQPALGVVDVTTGVIRQYATDSITQAVAGDGEGALYYAAQLQGTDSILSAADWVNITPGFIGCDETRNEAAIYRLDAQTGAIQQIYIGAHHSIPWMQLSPNGEYLYFTALPDGTAWRDAMLQQSCHQPDCDEQMLPDVYRLAINTGQTELVLSGVLKPAINFNYEPNNSARDGQP